MDYSSLHINVRSRTEYLWPRFSQSSFRFEMDAYQGSHPTSQQHEIFETFSYMAFKGPIRMSDPQNQFTVFEDFALNAASPHRIHLGRRVAESGRKAIAKYSLKKRSYIATTSMDAELSLVTANMALSRPGTLAYDPFMGTGSFPLACAHFGAVVFGSDLDGRSIRGKRGRSVMGNFEQYSIAPHYLGGFIADLTNTPLCPPHQAFLDAIICDPPYGVREGLKVLGSTKEALQREVLLENGQAAHLADSYIPPKRPYSFTQLLDDILEFAARALVERGRLCLWVPVAGVESQEAENSTKAFTLPRHPQLELVAECTQSFNKCESVRL